MPLDDQAVRRAAADFRLPLAEGRAAELAAEAGRLIGTVDRLSGRIGFDDDPFAFAAALARLKEPPR